MLSDPASVRRNVAERARRQAEEAVHTKFLRAEALREVDRRAKEQQEAEAEAAAAKMDASLALAHAHGQRVWDEAVLEATVAAVGGGGTSPQYSARFCATCAAPLFVGEAANFCSACGAPQPGVSHVLAPGSPGWTPPRSLREVMPP